MDHKYRVLILGPPASGKSTQARLLSQYLRIPHISWGKIVREIINKQPVYEYESLIQEAHLKNIQHPTDVVVEYLYENFLSSHNSYILEGFPKNVHEWTLLKKAIGKQEMTSVIFINTDLSLLKERSRTRVICPNCDHTYTNKLEHCPTDGGLLEQRWDEQYFTKRYKWFKSDISPILDELSQLKTYHEFDGNSEAMYLHQKIRNFVER